MKNESVLSIRKNILSGLILKISLVPTQLIVRWVISVKIGSEFLGFNSLMLSFLNVISFVELGFGLALTQALYQPLFQKDYNYIRRILSSYKRIYLLVGLAYISAGLLGLLILNQFKLIDNFDQIASLQFAFLYIISGSVNFFMYPEYIGLLNALERRNVFNWFTLLSKLLVFVIQFVCIYFFSNIYGFIFGLILIPLIRNCLVRLYCKYNLRFNTVDTIFKVDYGLLKFIWNQSRVVAIHRVGEALIITTDVFLISWLLGYGVSGIYSNYIFLISSIITVIDVMSNSSVASIGNSLLSESEKNNFDFYRKTTLYFNLFLGISGIGVLLFIDAVIGIWLGDKWIINEPYMALILSIFLVSFKSRLIPLTYRDSAGEWKYDRYKPIIGSIINLILGYYFIGNFGVIGAALSSTIVLVCIYVPWEIKLLNNKIFNSENFILQDQFKYLFFTFSILFLIYNINLIGIIPRIPFFLICVIVYLVIYVFIFFPKKKSFNV